MTCIRYFLNPDGSLRAVEEPGRCGEFWRMRWQSQQALDEGGARELKIKQDLHERNCEPCRQFHSDCERYSHNIEKARVHA